MPNRVLKESIRTSRTVNGMTDFQFRVWTYLITYVDDYGRGSADPELLKAFLFPRRKRVTEADMSRALSELADMGCILLYEVEGESYLCFPKWGEHQRIQQKRSKYPAPPDAIAPRLSTAAHGDPPPESNPIQSEIESPSESETESGDREPPVAALPLQGGGSYPVTRAQTREWAGLYPAVDVEQELRNMRGWLTANPDRRKTRAGIQRFINGWLAREQDKPKGGRGAKGAGPRFLQPVENSSLDLDEYEKRVARFVPVYDSKEGG